MDECLPERPQEPLASDCCGTGCSPCVFDIYDQELALWKAECEQIRLRLAGIDHQDTTSEAVISQDQYRSFEIQDILTETPDSFFYRFKIPENGCLRLNIGHHLIMRWKNNDSSVTRQYTPISALEARGYFDVVIKMYENGKMSQYIKTLQVGDLVEWRGPFGTFSYKPNTFPRILMLAAGTGIAPMFPVIKYILDNEEDETFITLIYGCKKYNDILCKKRLDEWQAYWNLKCLYALSQEDQQSDKSFRYGDEIHFGRVSEALLNEYIKDNINSTLVLFCGTRSFDKDMVNYLKRIGVPEDNCFKF